MTIFYYLALFSLLFILSKYVLHRKKGYPSGPLALPIIGHLHLVAKRPLHRTLAKLANKYGSILFLRYGSRPVVLVSSRAAVEECLTTNDIALASRPRLIAGQYLGYNYTSLVWSSYGDHWRNTRRIIALELFSAARLQQLLSLRLEEIHGFLRQLSKNADYDRLQKLNFKTMFFELMLNIIMRMIAGKRYFGENVENKEEALRFRHMVSETFYLMGASNFADFLPFLRWFDLQGLERRMAVAHKERDAFMQGLIEESRERARNKTNVNDGEMNKMESKRKQTLLDVLLENQVHDPKYYTDQTIKGIISNLLTAGTDTSSATMEWALGLLVNNPRVLKKARDEIDAVIGNQRLVEESDLTKLPYLHCVLNETLRHYPTGPVIIHESNRDCAIDGHHVPTGTMIFLNLWAVHRDETVWDKPYEFNPERFESPEWEKDKGVKLVPFGWGRRRCPGESLAWRMVGLSLGLLIQCFEWEREGEEPVDMTEGVGLTMPRANPLQVMYRPRPVMKQVLSQL
ncbi:hypothetical protein Sjap_022750 [Stephania japonica]|uniref:Cytochrome P450 n=1 Tax=Stephania japonica TaxID=461633 RepID=A0AAP0EWN4_9MAGN